MSEPAITVADSHITHDPRIRGLEFLISRLLRLGVITSVALIVVGAIVTFLQHPDYLTSRTELAKLVAPDANFPHAIPVLLRELSELRGDAIVTLGLLVLMATPVMRVLVSVIAFVYERDRIYILVTTTVLCLLLLSLVLGKVVR